MAEYDLGTAKGRIELDASGFKRGAADARKENDSLRGNLEQNRAAVAKTGAALTGVGVAMAAGFAKAVSTAADFEKEISNFNAAAKESPEVLEAVRAKAIQIGQDTSFGAAQAASAITNLSYAGLSTADILDGAADSAVALAEAGELDIPQAASIMSAAMNAFGIEAENTSQIADTMIGVFANSDTMVNELGEAFQQVSATAATAGVSLEDTTVALGLLADRGIKGGKAGTTLNRMLLSLQGSTGPAKEAMEELGLITEDGANKFFDAEGNMKDLASVSETLQGAMQGLTKEQQLAYLETIFGSRAMAAAAALAENGSEGFNELAASMGEVSSADVAADKLDNLSGSMTILKGTIETALIQAGSPFQTAIKGIIDVVTGLINKFSALSPSVRKIIGVVFLATAALTTLVGVGLLIAAAMTVASGAFAVFTGTILPIIGIIVGVIAAIAAIGFAIRYLWKNNETFRNVVTSAWNKIKDVIGAAVGVVMDVFDQLKVAWNILVGLFRGDSMAEEVAGQWGTAGAIIENVVEIIQNAGDAIVAVVSWVVEQVTTFWNNFGTHIITAAQNIMNYLIEFFRGTWENIKQFIEGILRAISGIFDVFAGIFTGDWSRVWGGIQKIFSGIWSAIHAVFSQIVQTIISVAKVGWQVLKTVIGAATAIIAQIFRGAWNAIATFFKSVWNGIKDAAKAVWNAIVQNFRRQGDILKSIWRNIWNIITGVVRGAWNGIKNFISGSLNTLKSIWRNAWSSVIGFIRNAWVRIVGGVRSGASSMMSFIRDLPRRILSGLGNIGSLLYNAGKDVIWGLINGIRNMAGAAARAARDAVSSAVGAAKRFLGISSPSTVFLGFGEDTMQGFVNGVRSMTRNAANAMQMTMEASVAPAQDVATGRGSTGTTSTASPVAPVSGPSQTVHIERIEALDPVEAARLTDQELGWEFRTMRGAG